MTNIFGIWTNLIDFPEETLYTLNMIENKRVYIVNFKNFYTGDSCFRMVFFTKEAAERYITESKSPYDYKIECFEETENGESKEIY